MQQSAVTLAFDAFATCYPGIIIDVNDLLKKRGYDLALAPFSFDGMNDLTEDQRWAKLKSGGIWGGRAPTSLPFLSRSLRRWSRRSERETCGFWRACSPPTLLRCVIRQ